MSEHLELINSFYSCFQKRDAEGMAACYHENIQFCDPAFPDLKGKMAGNMWRMLCSQAKIFELTFSDVTATGNTGKAYWEATYDFSRTSRRVHNKIHATFEFADGKIIKHVDDFDFWKWSQMALGAPGLMLGWSGFLRNKVSTMANKGLEKYCLDNGF